MLNNFNVTYIFVYVSNITYRNIVISGYQRQCSRWEKWVKGFKRYKFPVIK